MFDFLIIIWEESLEGVSKNFFKDFFYSLIWVISFI